MSIFFKPPLYPILHHNVTFYLSLRLDPPRFDSMKTINRLHDAGVEVKMVSIELF